MPLHGPVGGSVSDGTTNYESHGAGLIVVHLLVITKVVVPLFVALVLVPEVGAIPTIVLDLLSLLLCRAGGDRQKLLRVRKREKKEDS